MLKKLIETYTPSFIRKVFRYIKYDVGDGYATMSYSQEGEDMILKRLFEKQNTGFYVDVGAHHPKRFSNTYFFYKKAWRGINLDAMPGSMKPFRASRPRDINLEIPISDQKQQLTYYAFNEPALNGFCKELSHKRDGLNQYKIEFTQDMETSTLEGVLDKYLSKNQHIDFLSIDVEGLDFQVLKSNNFNKYRPKVILIELLQSDLASVVNDPITIFLASQNYALYAKCMNTVFFKLND